MTGLRYGAAVAAAAAAVALHAAGALDGLEWKTWDARVRHLTDVRPPGDVAILLIDQESLRFLQEEESIPWPWPRALYVPVVQYLRQCGARAIVFDILFTESSVLGEADDRELGAALAERDDVVLAAAVRDDRPGGEPVPAIRAGAAALGRVLVPPDADGVFRRIPMTEARGPSLPPLAVAALETATGRTPEATDGRTRLGGRALPLDRDGALVVKYYGPAGTIPSYSMAAAIQSYVRSGTGEEIPLPAERLRGRTVFLGMSAPGLMDLRPTPADAVYPGVEVHATVFRNLLANEWIRPAPAWSTALACLLVALLVAAVLGRFHGAVAGTLLLPVLVGAGAAPGIALFRADVWFPVVAPALAAALSFVSVRAVDYATEGRQRRFLRHAFRHYLSPAVIEEIVKNPGRLTLGGERKDLTILFSDVASFTSLAERLEPETLIRVLNRYLTEMTEVILEEGGTVDKYEGDAIIAFWNAPLDQPDHAARGAVAALRCVERLERINPELAREAGAPLAMRIGLHTGPVIVGNMGSRHRFDYTVLGDAANLASRIEGLGKVLASPVLLSEEARRGAGDAVLARDVGRVRVVGRREPARLFQPVARAGGDPIFPWWRADDTSFAEGLAAWERGDAAAAAAAFERLPDDPTACAYAAYCRARRDGTLTGEPGIWEAQGK